ncbi:MAG: transcriptional repressor [Sphaerochaetaceae bacterium]|nr:transcriptional repressor [Sphaerochaetaceae bacterium]MDC7246869.1 transcriptional repressor [Sphaerochaetaceae bacterium]
MRFSRQRQQILRTLQEFPEHPTAEQVFEKVRTQIPSISLGTVYRNLGMLVEQNVIRKFVSPGESSVRYDGRNDEHSHLVCEVCHKVFDIDVSTFSQLDEALEHDTGFSVKEHDIVLRGICRECREEKKINR